MLAARAAELGRRHGLTIDEPTILSDRSNLVVHLWPSPVVARVATVTADLRHEAAFDTMQRSVLVASRLAEMGAPVAPPSAELPPGPHREAGLLLTFFEFVDHDPDGELEPAAVASTLHEIHAALRSLGPRLPRLAPIAELPAIVGELKADGRLSEVDAERLSTWLREARRGIDIADLEEQPLHGDASLGNVLCTAAGPVWNDFEDACSGPLAWDLACLVATVRAFGRRREGAEETLAAYGVPDEGTLRPFIIARAVQAVVWRLRTGRPDPAALSSVEALIGDRVER